MADLSWLGSLFGGLGQTALNYQSVAATNNANREINRNNNLFNQMMWQREKEYNSPVAQMKRLQEAGINPAFAYSNGVSNTVSSAPTAANPIPMQAYTGNELAELGNRISLDSLRGIQKDVGESNVRLNDKTIAKYTSEIDLNDARIRELNASIEKLGSDIEVNNARFDLLTEQARKTGLEATGVEIDNWIKEATKNNKVLASELENDKMRADIKWLMQQIAVGKAEEKYLNKKTEWTEKDLERISEDIRKAKFWNDLNEESRQYLKDCIRFDRDQKEVTFNIDNSKWHKLRDYNNAYGKLDNFFTIAGKFLDSLSPFD